MENRNIETRNEDGRGGGIKVIGLHDGGGGGIKVIGLPVGASENDLADVAAEMEDGAVVDVIMQPGVGIDVERIAEIAMANGVQIRRVELES